MVSDAFAVLKLAGVVLLVILILVGALMPLKYTARMQLPKKAPGPSEGCTDQSRTNERDA